MEKQKYIAVYIRVSSAAQNLELQKEAANRYLESQGLTGDEDLYYFSLIKMSLLLNYLWKIELN